MTIPKRYRVVFHQWFTQMHLHGSSDEHDLSLLMEANTGTQAVSPERTIQP